MILQKIIQFFDTFTDITVKTKRIGFTTHDDRVFKLKKSSRKKLQSSRSTIGSLVEWGEQPRPFCREEWGASPGKFKNQGSLINELYSLVCFAPVTDFVDRHCTLINKG